MFKIRYVFGALLAVLLSGCHAALLNPTGVNAATEKQILINSVLLMLIIVIPVIIMSFVFPFRYRASNKKATYHPDWSHSTAMEIICWAVPCIIIAILATWVWIYSHSLDPFRPLAADDDTVIVEAIALDWKWLFIYPQQRVASVNEMFIPVNKPVRIYITSDAPMNGFQIPRLGTQIYAMAGMQTQLNMIATQEGIYSGFSANFSGDGFSGMHFKTHVVDAQSYQNWLNQLSQSPTHLTMDAYNQLAQPSENNPITYYSHAEPGLFSASIVKYMGPMPGMALGYASVSQKKN